MSVQAREGMEDQVIAFVERVRDKVDAPGGAGRRRRWSLSWKM